MRKLGKSAYVLALAAFGSSAVSAETLSVEVRRPAAADEAYMLRSLAVERFTGTDGPAFSNAVERALAEARDSNGGRVFEMYAAGRGEGAVTGRADVDIAQTRYKEKRKLCPISNDRNAKCDDAVKEDVEVNCRRRSISFNADIRIVRESDGRIAYSRNLPNRAEHRSCDGDPAMPNEADIIENIISSTARSVTGDFIPYAARENIRIREDRKGLSKPDGELFKLAVKATKASGAEACRQFGAIAERAPDQKSITYNLALCAEAAGDYEAAIAGYRQLGNAVDALSAIERAQGTLAGLAQQAARDGSGR